MDLEGPLSLVRLLFHRSGAGVREMKLSKGNGWVEVCMYLLLENLKSLLK